MSREIMQQALDALIFAENFTKGVIDNSEEINAIRKELRYNGANEKLAQPTNEFHPDWDTLKPYHDRIAELEAQIAKPEYPDLRKAAEMALESLLDANNMALMELSIDDAYEDEIEALRQALSQPEQEPVAWITRRNGDGGVVLSGYETCEPIDYDATPVYTAPPSTSGYAKKIESLIKERDELRQALAQPDHPLDKKADNARELGLDYKPDHGFDRTASHMAEEYVDTAQSEPIVIMGHYVGEGKVVSASFGLPEGSFDMSTNQQNVNTSEERVHKSEECVHEPVAWQVMVENEPMKEFSIKDMAHDWAVTEKLNGSKYSYWIRPLYAAPPKREWVGLTHEELDLIYKQHHNEYGQGVTGQYERVIQAKLREKNT